MRRTVLLLSAICVSYGAPSIDIQYPAADGYVFSAADRLAIQTVAEATEQEAHRLLPALARLLLLEVRAGADVIPETGETAGTADPNKVM